jgi:putative transposase
MINRELAMTSLLMAVLRGQPKNTGMGHSDQDSQLSSYERRNCLDQHNLQQSMRWRKNYHDNASSRDFFSAVKLERVRRKI